MTAAFNSAPMRLCLTGSGLTVKCVRGVSPSKSAFQSWVVFNGKISAALEHSDYWETAQFCASGLLDIASAPCTHQRARQGFCRPLQHILWTLHKLLMKQLSFHACMSNTPYLSLWRVVHNTVFAKNVPCMHKTWFSKALKPNKSKVFITETLKFLC